MVLENSLFENGGKYVCTPTHQVKELNPEQIRNLAITAINCVLCSSWLNVEE
jgi:hypothetical protein